MRIYSYKPPKITSSRSKFKFKFPRKFNARKIFTWVFRLFAIGILFSAVLFLYYAKDLPDPNKLLDRRNVPESTKIFAKDNSLLYEIHGGYKRTQVGLDQISESLKNATIAIEDKDFYKHGGISFTGMARAVLVDIKNLDKSQGGSTITQQFVKKAILTDDKSWDRKIREIILAIAIDSRFSKNEILKLYLNEIPYGRNAYGIEAAAQSYFNKSAKDLSLAESAYLAALPQAPSRYNPLGPNRQLLDARKNTVLSYMQQQGYITEEQRAKASEEKVEFSPLTYGIKAPHFVLWVQDYLADKYGEKTLEEGGLKVYTTLDPKLQEIAETAVSEGVAKSSKKYDANNAALVAIDPKTGHILAMVGSKDYFGKSEPEGCTPGKSCKFEPNTNAAVSQRQPGSSFKPYVYATAFKKEFKYSPASLLIDVTTNFGKFGGKDYIPHNYNGQSYGPLSMRKALAGSLNVPAVKTLALVGVDSATQTARDLGITSPLADCGLSLVLGGCEVRLVDHVAAFSVIANGGTKNEKTAILKVEDKNGKTLEEFQSKPKNVLDPQAAYELINIMTDNEARSFIFGPNSPLILPGRPVAAKTGTTNDWGDGWTMGFTPSLAAGVWAGNNCGVKQCPMKRGADGVLVAAPIWHNFMVQALAGTPAEAFAEPEGIKRVSVDTLSGKLPTDLTPATKTEVFADYSVPTEYDNVHIKVAVDSLTGQPANEFTPPSQIIYQTYTVLHSEQPQNPDWENPVVTWALANGYSYPSGQITPGTIPGGDNNNLTVSIVEPQDGATISKMPFTVMVSAIAPNPISTLELYINGERYQTLQNQPFIFTVNKALPAGAHTLAVHAVDSNGNKADISSSITYQPAPALGMVEPLDQSLVQFPIILTAESDQIYGNISFYYQNSKGQTKLIGQASNTDHVGKYRYTLTWQNPPPAGVYKIYAQEINGIVTKKVQITVP